MANPWLHQDARKAMTKETKEAVRLLKRIKRHLLKQGKKSMAMFGGKKTCVYRSPEGLRCAVGCLIPKRHYNPLAEGKCVPFPTTGGWSNLSHTPALDDGDKAIRAMFNAAKIPATAAVKDALDKAQTIHDECRPGTWAKKMDKLIEETAKG